MPNPKGHPKSLEAYKLKTDRDEPLTGKLTIRITKSMEDKLQGLGDKKAEFCRGAIKKALDDCDKSEG
ncbi:hypothetical protein VB711_22160 [Cronbergia sp. UHCC 0137]|uniref:hypothetical protein n=1 Tax=Cronbergia sp. UHCC 0137 TaxID=3110239 RepID=UPI002B20EA3B|nr:hypothetical protein [Cronbergia sp. UHCC 0137]MEA5620522.1 hypothetical protein [Cronbergia sp. UHCC 0137]